MAQFQNASFGQPPQKENEKKKKKNHQKTSNVASLLLSITEHFQLNQLEKSTALSYFTLWQSIDMNCLNLFLEAGNSSS